MTLINCRHLGKHSHVKHWGSSLKLYLMTWVCSGSFEDMIFHRALPWMVGDMGTDRMKSERKSEQNSMVTRYKSIEYESKMYLRGTSRKSDVQTSKNINLFIKRKA